MFGKVATKKLRTILEFLFGFLGFDGGETIE